MPDLERRLTLHQLRILKTVVDRGGVTRAAEALRLTQPAVTHQVQTIAQSLGHSLFQPGKGNLDLTEVGRALYERAGAILALVQEAGASIDDLIGVRSGRLTVAGDTTVGIYVLPDALASFHYLHPGVALNLEVVNRRLVREQLLGGDADLGVVGRLWEDGRLEGEPLMQNQLMCYCGPDHPLRGRRGLTPADLLEGPLLLREPGSGTRESVELILRAAGVEPTPAMQIASNGALKRAVVRGLGVTVLSTYAVRLELQMGHLFPLSVLGFPTRRVWHVVWPRARLLSPAGQAFRRHLHDPAWKVGLGSPLGHE